MERLRAQVLVLAAVFVVLGLAAGPASAQQPPGPGRGGQRLLRDDRRAPVPELRGHPGQPGAQQHPGEPARPRGRHAVHGRPAGRPRHRADHAAELHADHRLALHARHGHRGQAGRARGGRCRSSARRSRPTSRRSASVPDRDAPGPPDRGHVDRRRDDDRADRRAGEAARRSRAALWIQGGTPTDPVLASVPAFADEYGFGALRCAIDNLNGDNVEWIKFPTGSRHVYCFAYYVDAAADERDDRDPQGGLATRRRPTRRSPSRATSPTRPTARFPLTVTNGQAGLGDLLPRRHRPGDAPWTVRELVPDGLGAHRPRVHGRRERRSRPTRRTPRSRSACWRATPSPARSPTPCARRPGSC